MESDMLQNGEPKRYLLPPATVGFVLTSDEFSILKEVFLHTGGTQIDMGMSCVEKVNELRRAIYRRTGIDFEVYT